MEMKTNANASFNQRQLTGAGEAIERSSGGMMRAELKKTHDKTENRKECACYDNDQKRNNQREKQ